MKIKNQHKRVRKGFSLVEVSVVLVIIAILAAIATPSIFAFLRQGQQVNRDNIARTLYLAAQSRLTQLRITRGLESVVINEGLAEKPDDELIPTLTTMVYGANGLDALPDNEEDWNEEFVHFIKKDAGAYPTGLMRQLLESVPNPEVLNGAILIEFNIKTGVVLSVFYSDRPEHAAGFTYAAADGARSVLGERPYTEAADRNQGYYGVGSTGATDPDFEYVNIDVYDSDTHNRPPPGSTSRNVLYAEIYIPDNRLTEPFSVSILGSSLSVEDIYFASLPTSINSREDNLYRFGDNYVIWILDYVTGDTTSLVSEIPGTFPADKDVIAEFIDSYGNPFESQRTHPYFAGHLDGVNSITSARHLYNIRHDATGTFTLENDIKLSDHITSFDPIPDFSGTFNGNGKTISNLDVSKTGNAGLFAEVTGKVENLILENPIVTGATAGAVAGELNGTVSRVYVRFDDGTINGTASAGGIAGVLGEGGKIEDVTVISASEQSPIRGYEDDTEVGGIVGGNAGAIENALYLAIAPENEDGNLVPITLDEGEGVSNAYYLSGEPIRPESRDPEDEDEGFTYYNDTREYAEDIIGMALGTNELYQENISGWMKNTVEDVLARDNLIYPYRFPADFDFLLGGSQESPFWPIAEREEAEDTGLYVYYELYDDEDYGYWYRDEDGEEKDGLKSVDDIDSSAILKWGYILFTTKEKGDLALAEDFGELMEALNGLRGEDKEPLRYAYVLDEDHNNLEPIQLPDMEEIKYSYFNPLFAKAIFENIEEYEEDENYRYIIRTPRHLQNISTDSTTLGGSFIQELALDFEEPLTTSAVTDIFTGDYDGGGKEILNLTITENNNNVGLFSVNGGTIQNVALVNATITGNENVGSLAGTNEGTITGSRVLGVTVEGTSNVGGIAGTNAGTITQSFAGMRSGSSFNEVVGNNYVGGIAGQSSGNISICYVDFTRVGKDGSTNVGGVVGYIGDGSVQNVFYNYGNNSPQVNNWERSVFGTTASTGGLVGIIDGGTLSNAYSTAYFGDDFNPVIGTASPGGLNNTVLYLRVTGYNVNVDAGRGRATNVDDLKNARATLNGVTPSSGRWVQGSNNIPYPRLAALTEQAIPHWPEPDATVLRFAYYEIYPDVNEKTGEKYGLWAGYNDDKLDYSQKVLEDGYIAFTTMPGNSGAYMVRKMNGDVLHEGKTGESGEIPALGGESYVVFNLEDLISHMPDDNGIEPIRVTIGQGNAEKADYFDGYINPLFGKAIWSLNSVPDISNYEYTIRTPRHLNNIGKDSSTRSGKYRQEIDIDFSGLNTTTGYQNPTNTTTSGTDSGSNGFINADRTNINITASVVQGNFTGQYNGNSKAIKNIGTATNDQGKINGGGNVGIFSQIGADGRVENLILRNNAVTGTGDNVGGLAGTNSGTIREIELYDGAVSGGDNVGGLVGTNSGAVSGIELYDGAVSGGDNVGGLAGTNSGAVSGVELRGANTVSGGSNVGGIIGLEDNSAGISGMTAANVTVTATGSNAGGVVGSAASVSNSHAVDVTVTGGSNAGGVVGNAASVSNSHAVDVTVNGGNDIGGVVGSTASVTGSSVSGASSVSGGTNVGGVVGKVNVVMGSFAVNVTVNANSANAGGVAGSAASVFGSYVRGKSVTGETNVGGLAGHVSGEVSDSYAENVKVAGETNVGGLIGKTEGDISDVFFLSTETESPITGSENVGGIVGDAGSNAVSRALYLAPAPKVSGDTINIFPIQGRAVDDDDDDDATVPNVSDAFYIYGRQYTVEGNQGPAANWIAGNYNIPPLAANVVGGGQGLYASFLNLDFLPLIAKSGEFEIAEWAKWNQPPAGYHYPLLNNAAAPQNWPETNGPVRLDQVDRADRAADIDDDNPLLHGPAWEPTLSSNSVGSIGFINGDFDMPLMNPNDPDQSYEVVSQFTSGAFNLVNNAPGLIFPAGPRVDSGNWSHQWIYAHQSWVQGWNTRPAADITLSDATLDQIYSIEFQNPHPLADSGRARTNYMGTATGVYAELNAEIPGTLYQISHTFPGTETYYSFYHAARFNNNTDTLKFYLSDMTNNDGIWEYVDGKQTIIRPATTKRGSATGMPQTRDTIMYGEVSFYDSVIEDERTAYLYDVWLNGPGLGITFWSEEGVTTLTNNYNTISDLPASLRDDAEKNIIGYWDVAYLPGATYQMTTYAYNNSGSGTGAGGRLSNDFVNANLTTLFTLSVADGTYVDLLNTDGTRYTTTAGGVTYRYRFTYNTWSNGRELCIEIYNNSTNALVRTDYYRPSLTPTTYTGRISEWKQYYGLYTIPEGQNYTEFAYESASLNDPKQGNYLAGITFQSPGFLSIDKRVLDDDGREVKFVKPGDVLTVELTVRNHGEVTVGDIVIEDILAPFDRYYDFVPGSVKVNASARSGAPVGGKLTIDGLGTLASNAVLTVTFDIQIRFDIQNSSGDDPTPADTMHYYIRNQATVSYRDSAFGNGYVGRLAPYTDNANTKNNASDRDAVQVFIDPVKLEKEVEDLGGGVFEVTLTAETTAVISTNGVISVVIPPEFAVSNIVGLVIEPGTTDGFTRLTKSVDLEQASTALSPDTWSGSYTLTYDGDDHGVIFDSVTADYRYMFELATQVGYGLLPARLNFPRTVVGIPIEAENKSIKIDPEEITPGPFGVPGSIIIDLLGDLLEKIRGDGGHAVRPEVVLYNEEGVKAARNANGNYEVRIARGTEANRVHIIELLQAVDGSAVQLVITLLPIDSALADWHEYEADKFTIYYSVELEAAGLILSSEIMKIDVEVDASKPKELGAVAGRSFEMMAAAIPCACFDACACDDGCVCECTCGGAPSPYDSVVLAGGLSIQQLLKRRKLSKNRKAKRCAGR
ncbi:MAG: prepilin-type N-terminal cleavage/methylation domain-containing protein [Oscillospiraceae bacterium]|nr:prepilin-type N-terminal cleavage/methylation domain-containing protein [Oscillospiraceae bacterium]